MKFLSIITYSQSGVFHAQVIISPKLKQKVDRYVNIAEIVFFTKTSIVVMTTRSLAPIQNQ